MTESQPEQLREIIASGYRFAHSLTHDSARAEDLVQDAWFSVLRAAGPRTQAYLFATIRNRFIDLCRRERTVPFVSLEGIGHEQAAGQDPDDSATADERAPFEVSHGVLHAALARLRPEERAALFLMSVEGFSAQQVADLFNWPRGTVLSCVHRTRAKLRRLMKAEMEAQS